MLDVSSRAGSTSWTVIGAEWRHKDIELAAHDLLQHLDSTSG